MGYLRSAWIGRGIRGSGQSPRHVIELRRGQLLDCFVSIAGGDSTADGSGTPGTGDGTHRLEERFTNRRVDRRFSDLGFTEAHVDGDPVHLNWFHVPETRSFRGQDHLRHKVTPDQSLRLCRNKEVLFG